MMVVGVDAHKKQCTTCLFDDVKGTAVESGAFPTTRQAVTEFMERFPQGTTVVIESSTTGKTVSKILSSKFQVHMVAPPERKATIKTNKRDAERIIKEDLLGYLRRCYIPSPYVEGLRFMVTKQMEIGQKISRVKDQVHALIERNMLQSEFSDLSDIFSVKGLERLSSLTLPREEAVALAMYLEELKLYTKQHRQMESEIANAAISDEDCQLLMSIPGVASFTSVTLKARIGDASRFPSKKHLCSYAGIVPKANNTGENISMHNHVKHGDATLKYALTCAVRGAVAAGKNSAVKRFYLKQIRKGKSPQEAEVAAARKLACITWKVLTSKQKYVEEDRYLTARKIKRISFIAKRHLTYASKPEDVPSLIKSLTENSDVLERYSEHMHRRGKGSRSSTSLLQDVTRRKGP